MDPSDALWIGGPPECPVEPLARALADRLELRLYSLAEHAADYELRLPAGGEDGSLSSFVARSRHVFRLVLEDLRALPDEPGVVVAGAGLFPTSVSAVLRFPQDALFLLPAIDAEWSGSARMVAREARELRLAVLGVDEPIGLLVESAAKQIGRRDDDPHHEAE